VLRDRTMMGAILISFTVAVYVVAVGAKADVTNVTIGIIDHDQSTLSQRIRAAVAPMPMFQTPVDLTPETCPSGDGRGTVSCSSSRSPSSSRPISTASAPRACN
jgi:ABC-2 type transport system permease protein